MVYTLTLTYADRQAIDWIDHRYLHGETLANLLTFSCEWKAGCNLSDCAWGDRLDITFLIPEHIAWIISDIIDEDNLACFAPPLVEKLLSFQEQIV